MKFKGVIRMLAVLICACTLMLIPMSDVTHAEYTKEDLLYFPDDTLSKYVEEHLPDGDYEMIDSGDAIISYSQMAGADNVSYVRGELAKEYGISEVKYYTYKNTMSSTSSCHFFFDIHLSADAVVTDKDNIQVVTSGDGFIVISTKAALYVMDKNKTWDFVSNVNVLFGSATGYVPFWGGGDVLNNGKERRIFVYVPAEPGVEWNSGKDCEVNWEQDILRLAELPVSQEKEDNSQPMWKIILIGLIVVFDVAMFVFFLKYIKKPQKEVPS